MSNIPFELVGEVAGAGAVAEAGDIERGAAAARHVGDVRWSTWTARVNGIDGAVVASEAVVVVGKESVRLETRTLNLRGNYVTALVPTRKSALSAAFTQCSWTKTVAAAGCNC